MAYLPIFWSNSVAYQGYNVPAAAIAEKQNRQLDNQVAAVEEVPVIVKSL